MSGSVQPRCGASITALTSTNRPTTESTAPPASIGSSVRGPWRGSTAAPTTRMAAVKGTLSRKLHRQPAADTTKPPIIGPAARPMALAEAQVASARGRRPGSKICAVSASAGANSSAAPMPITARQSTS